MIGIAHPAHRKGVALLITMGILFSVTLVIAAMMMVLRARIRQHERSTDRLIAYYLCETAQTFAQLDFSIPNRIESGKTREYEVELGGVKHKVWYKATKQAIPPGSYEIISWVNSPLGLGGTYKLKMSAGRTFPFFIGGKGG